MRACIYMFRIVVAEAETNCDGSHIPQHYTITPAPENLGDDRFNEYHVICPFSSHNTITKQQYVQLIPIHLGFLPTSCIPDPDAGEEQDNTPTFVVEAGKESIIGC